MWIELAGPPGVGKSTVFKQFIGPTLNPLKSGPLPWEWKKWNDATEKWFRRHCTRRLASFQRKVKAASAVTQQCLSDDLLVQRGQSMAAAGAPDDVIHRYYETMPEPAGVVFLTNNLDVIVERNKNRRRDLSPEAERAIKVFAVAKEILSDRGVNLIELETYQEPALVAKKITERFFR